MAQTGEPELRVLQERVEGAVGAAVERASDGDTDLEIKQRALRIVVHREGIVEPGPLQEAAGVIERVYERAAG
jgi:hypothetical protein